MISEKDIIIGLITDGEYMREIEDEWNPEYIEGQAAGKLSKWCWDYYKQYKKAPMRDIEKIFTAEYAAGNINKDLAEDIEDNILPSLSDSYDANGNAEYLLKETREFFTERQIQLHQDRVDFLLGKGQVKEAEQEIDNFKIKKKVESQGLNLASPDALPKVREALNQSYQNIIQFPGALGDFWNDSLVRGGLVAILAPEKRGKTYWLLELMMRAYRQKRKVAFFQAGDMTEAQQIIRTAVYLAKRSNLERYCGERYIPIQDCIKNQKDTCSKRVRECNFGLFGEEMNTREKITKEDLIDALESNPDYKPCFNCTDWYKNRWGTPWLMKVDAKKPLDAKEAERLWTRFFIKAGRDIRLSTHANLTLRIKDIEAILSQWERENGFVPDLILIDYADILAPEIKGDVRAVENHKWMRLRALSQSPHEPLVVVPTQADAPSYKQNSLDMGNFSETKTKNAHVTAMYGLNQDVDGREKDIGIMRLNKVALREGDFHPTQQVHVLHHLAMGRPFLGSYY